MSQSTVSYLWREPQAARDYTTGVSLHSHTSQSRETLDFIADMSRDIPAIQGLIQWAEDRCMRYSGMKPDYLQALGEFRAYYQQECAKARIDFVPVDTSISFDKALMEYLLQRQRRF